jgi:MFS transporter, DHA1 family, tetracycline resistance protein
MSGPSPRLHPNEAAMTEPTSTPAELPNPLLTEPELPAAGTPDPVLPQPPRRAAAIFIFFTIALDMIAMGMIAPVLPHLISGFLGGSAARTASMLGIFGTVFAAMQFFFSPVVGSLSDRWGRRPVVLISNFGLGLDYLVMAVAPTLPWLFAGRVISGLTASSIPTAMAYMSDVTPHEKRAAAYGMLSAAFGMGFVLGPALGGVLGNINPRLPFWAAGLLSLVNGLYGLFVLPESLAREHRMAFSWRRANPIGSVALLRRSRLLLGVAAVLLLGYLAQQVLMNVYVLYADYRYSWSDRTVGLSLALVGICSGVYSGVLVKRSVKLFGERGSMLIGLLLGSVGMALIGFAKTGSMLWFSIPVMNLMSLTWPAAQSLMSRGIGPSEQGQLQGAINSLRGIAGLIGPGLFTAIFAQAVRAHRSPGAPFFLAAALLLFGAAASLAATRGAGRPEAAGAA